MVSKAVVSTLAGGFDGTNRAYADGVGPNAGFYYPQGVAIDASGSVFVADTENNRIRKVTAGGGTLAVTLRACFSSDYCSLNVSGWGAQAWTLTLTHLLRLLFEIFVA